MATALVDYSSSDNSDDDNSQSFKPNVPNQPLSVPPRRQQGTRALHIHVPVPFRDGLSDFVERLVTEAQLANPDITAIPSPHHVSLSRPVQLRDFQVDRFVSQLGQELQTFTSFRLSFGSLAHYVNDEHTRSFLALNVGYGRDALSQLLQAVNRVLERFALPTFYDEPRFHLSVASTPTPTGIGSATVHRLRMNAADFQGELAYEARCRNSDFLVEVRHVVCRVGRQSYTLSLS
ncbi:poly(U)-specific 3'-to-5' RNA exonuclease [Dispira parvispora]|uniref:U6 snRNA phosphodiesterase 1 n=1 Tax=Dispira parvispora TaxID=1520584 RepID=A0A9W8ARB1_9FUNG|nr:poly(U)-specific 3'-to-5' RNA exonuclease [Dispira parvispora]